MAPIRSSCPSAELKNAFHSAAIPETLCWTMLSIIVMAWDTVIGMDWNFAFVSSAMLKREFFTTPAETIPFSAYFLMEPSAHPMLCSMVLAIPGAASRMEFNSSPRSAPAAMAWVSCTMAFFCSWAVAPPMANCLLTCSMNAISSVLEENAFPALTPIFAMASAVSR